MSSELTRTHCDGSDLRMHPCPRLLIFMKLFLRIKAEMLTIFFSDNIFHLVESVDVLLPLAQWYGTVYEWRLLA